MWTITVITRRARQRWWEQNKIKKVDRINNSQKQCEHSKDMCVCVFECVFVHIVFAWTPSYLSLDLFERLSILLAVHFSATLTPDMFCYFFISFVCLFVCLFVWLYFIFSSSSSSCFNSFYHSLTQSFIHFICCCCFFSVGSSCTYLFFFASLLCIYLAKITI